MYANVYVRRPSIVRLERHPPYIVRRDAMPTVLYKC
jgi:hypothetical protein